MATALWLQRACDVLPPKHMLREQIVINLHPAMVNCRVTGELSLHEFLFIVLAVSNAQGYQLCFCVLEESGFFHLFLFLFFLQ